MNQSILKLGIIALSSTLAACGSDTETVDSSGRSGADTANYSDLDATQGRAYLDLESGHSVTSTDQWHFSYQKYVGFSINGGISGDAGIASCIAHIPEGIYDVNGAPVQSAFEALTRDNTQADFDAVTATNCTADFAEDSIDLQIDMENWLAADYSAGAPVFSASSDASNGWIIQSASKNDSDIYEYARVKVSTVDYSAGVKRAITLESEIWDDNASVFLSAVTSPELNFTDNRVYWDMETNSIVTADQNWDLSIVVDERNWNIQVNGGVSGEGSAAVATLLVDSASQVSNPASGTTGDVYKYYSDSASSVLSGPGNYGAFSYGVDDSHNMWPNFTTYLFKDGTRYYKAQIVSNYGEDGTASSGNLYVRYAEITE